MANNRVVEFTRIINVAAITNKKELDLELIRALDQENQQIDRKVSQRGGYRIFPGGGRNRRLLKTIFFCELEFWEQGHILFFIII